MIKYLVEWLHLYSIHFGAIVAILMLFELYKNGLPDDFRNFKGKLISAVVLAGVLAIFSSHCNTHMLFHVLKAVK